MSDNVPKYKKDYPGHRVCLLADAPHDIHDMFRDGCVAVIERRVKALEMMHGPKPLPGDGDVWWLRLRRICPLCGCNLEAHVPESWITESKLLFLPESAEVSSS